MWRLYRHQFKTCHPAEHFELPSESGYKPGSLDPVFWNHGFYQLLELCGDSCWLDLSSLSEASSDLKQRCLKPEYWPCVFHWRGRVPALWRSLLTSCPHQKWEHVVETDICCFCIQNQVFSNSCFVLFYTLKPIFIFLTRLYKLCSAY